MRTREIGFLLLSVFFFCCVPASAQGLLGKSQFLIAYESNAAILGQVVHVAKPPDGLYTGVSNSQTVVFKVKRRLKGKFEDKFVKVNFAVPNGINLEGVLLEESEYIIFLDKNSGNGDSDFCGDFEWDSKAGKFMAAKGSKHAFKMPCYFADLKSVVEGTKREIETVSSFLTFLENGNKN
jgi:hypothetical protein